jgi:hypothetical protein
MSGPKRWTLIVSVVFAALVLALVVGMHFAARSVKQSILQALGPECDATEVNVRLTSMEIRDVRIRAPKG